MPYSKAELVQSALDKVKSPEILVNMVSQRVKQLGLGYRPLVPVDPRWSFMDVALREIAEEKLTFEVIPQEEVSPKPRDKRTPRARRSSR
jgi:DNA-directed RNA polymerase subunit omega